MTGKHEKDQNFEVYFLINKIDRAMEENSNVNWDKERSEHWKARAEEIKAEQNKGV